MEKYIKSIELIILIVSIVKKLLTKVRNSDYHHHHPYYTYYMTHLISIFCHKITSTLFRTFTQILSNIDPLNRTNTHIT